MQTAGNLVVDAIRSTAAIGLISTIIALDAGVVTVISADLFSVD